MNHFRRFFPAILSLLLVAAAPAQDSKLSIATVDVQTLFVNYHRTKEAQKQIDVDKALIQKENDQRLESIRALEEQLETLGKQLEDTTISMPKKQEISKERQMKYQEGITLDRERREFLKRRNQALNEKLGDRMKSIYGEILEIVQEQAKLGDYDYVFDKSGRSMSQVPFLLYTKDATDITPDLLKVLNKDAPKEEKSEE